MDKNMIFEHKKTYLRKLLLDGFISAMHSYKELFKSAFNDNDTSKLTIALAYLNESHNYYVNAETFLTDNVELFDMRSEFENFFHCFHVYNKEVLTNIRTDHNHQWSDIEFRAFVDSFKIVASMLDIDNDGYWVNLALSSSEK